MVEKIVELFPSRIEDVNIDGKNILLLAIEYRQVEVFDFLSKQEWLRESLLDQVDNDGNNALHLIARPKVEFDWPNPKRTLSMSTELTWFEFLKSLMPCGLGERYNRKMETPDDIFRENHTELMKNEAEWVAKTSQACSVVSTLVVSVAFATRTDVPGGFDDKGYAILRNKSGFKHFANSSFAALFFSLISTIFFLSIVASPSGALLWSYVSFKFYIGISFMFLSIVCLSISFCAADFFMLDDDSLQAMHYSPKNHMLLSLIIALLVVVELPTFLRPIFPEISPFPSYRGRSTLPIEYRRTENKENSRELRHQN